MNNEACPSVFLPIVSSPNKLQFLQEVISRMNRSQLTRMRRYLATERTTIDAAVQIINDIAPVQTNAPLNLIANSDTATQKPLTSQELVRVAQEHQVFFQHEQNTHEHKWRLCADAIGRIHQTTSIAEVIDVLGEAAKSIVSARQCVISLKPGEHAIERVAVFPPRKEYCSSNMAGIIPYVRRRIRQTRKPLRLTHTELQSRRNRYSYAGVELDVMQGNGLLAVPFPERNGRIPGLIQLTDKDEGDFSEFDELLLGQMVQNVAVALENARLYDELRAHDRRKDEFLATLAHELRNPLAPLRTGLQLLQRSGDQTLKFVTRQTMERQLAHLTLLIDDLLDVSRINIGKLRLRKSRFDFRTVVHTALEAIRPLVIARNHELVIDLPQLPLPLEADATRLCQVLVNLLNNAAKYTPPRGQIKLSVTTLENTLTLKVQDNGVGISQDMLPRLFDLFMQIDSSAEHAQGGLGVGLPLVRRLVDMHGGTIMASSDGLGKGSTFVIELPLAQCLVAVPLTAPDPAQLVASGSLHILVVDDNVDAAESLAALLQLSGHTVSLTHEGQNAVEFATLLKPQVIVLDIGLPGISGYEIARVLRRDDTYHPMLIALTGWGSEEDRQLALAAGFDEHLVKPMDINRLNELLQMSNYRCGQELHDELLSQAHEQA